MTKVKTLAAAALLSAALPAFAASNFGSIEYNYVDGENAAQGITAHGAAVTLGRFVAPQTSVDITTRFYRVKDVAESVNELEVGATHRYSLSSLVNGLGLYARGAVGQTFAPGEDFAYYSIEPGVSLQVTEKFLVNAGYRYRDTFKSEYDDTAFNTIRLGVEYALDNASSVRAGYDRITGENGVRADAVNVSYNFRF